jgi:hypothetical protein
MQNEFEMIEHVHLRSREEVDTSTKYDCTFEYVQEIEQL